jgi:TonB-linked SusC/RagA family outer membrane protein
MRKIASLFLVLLLCITAAIAQTRPITGKVTDDKGQPISGAAVIIKSTHAGAAADTNGVFKISAKDGDVLVVSAVNFTSKEFKVVAGKDSYSATLAETGGALSEVVVTTALGVKRQAKELGYSTATVSNKDLTQARVTNFVTGLAAKVSGVDIRLADNGINPSVKVTFRGSRSITGNNGALIIVDGNPVDQSYLATLNPDDIDNTTILKGPNAAALYGKDASNGVMVVTTKHGRKGPWNISYKNTTMAETVSYMPGLQTEYSPNGGEGAGYNNPSATDGCKGCVTYIDPSTGTALPVPFENQNYGTAYNSKDFPYSQIAVGLDLNGNIKYVPFAAVKNGRRDFFQTGLSEQNDLSVSKGGKLGSFMISGSNVINKGVIPTEKNVRNTITGNGNLTMGKFTASGGITYSTQNINQVGLGFTGGTQYRPVYWDVINQPANVNLKDFKNVDTDPYAGLQGYANAYYPNPWYQVNHSKSNQKNDNIITNLTLNYQLFSWLKLTARGGYNKRTRNAPAYIDSFQYQQYSYGVFADKPTYDPWGAGNVASSYPSLPYQYELVKTDFDDLNTDGFFTATKSLKEFKFTLIGGANYRSQNSHGYWYSNQATSVIAIPNASTKVTNTDGSAYMNLNYKARSQSAYADLNVNYLGWVNLHGSFRNDWLSILDPKTRSFNYYGGDLAVLLSDKLTSLKDHGIYLKLRGGYAITGNASLAGSTSLGFLGGGGTGFSIPNYGAYAIYPTVSLGSGYPYGSLNGYSLSTSAYQSQLKPEKDYSSEIGFELGILKNRIALDVTAYNTVAKQQNLPLQTSTASGITNFVLNAGQMTSKGYEIGLKLTPFLNFGKFDWNLGINFTQQDNKVNSLLPGNDTLVLLNGTTYEIAAISGNPYPMLLVKDFQRDPQGHIIVDGSTGLPTADPKLKVAGNTQYKYLLGLTSTMNYKRFSLNMVWDYRSGAKILNRVGSAMDFAGISSSSGANREHFIVPNSVIDEGGGKYVTNTDIPIVGAPSQWWYSTYSTVMSPYVVSAAFWKLREVSLSYDIHLNRDFKYLHGLSVALVGQNLLMIRPKTNQWTDPEFSAQGTGNAVGYTTEYQTPPTRRFGITLTANL